MTVTAMRRKLARREPMASQCAGHDLHITGHAIERCIERVPGIRTEDEARGIMTTNVVRAAVAFGAPFVKLGTGQRIVIEAGSIVTVLPADTVRGRLDPRRRNATGARRVAELVRSSD